MDRLRQSLRASIRRKKDRSYSLDPTIQSGSSEMLPDNSKPNQFQIDDIAVRSGLCNFQVKVSQLNYTLEMNVWEKSWYGYTVWLIFITG